MKDIPAQFHSFRKTTLGDNVISFRVDQLYSDTVGELVQAQIGTEYVMKLEEVNAGTVLGESSPKDTEEKFRIRMHVLLGKIAAIRDTTPAVEKKKLKESLIEAGAILESTKELDIKQLANVCNELEAIVKEDEK